MYYHGDMICKYCSAHVFIVVMIVIVCGGILS